MKTFVCLLCLQVLSCTYLLAQKIDPLKKQLEVTRQEASIKLDGILEEPDWQRATASSDFVEYAPNPGTTPSQKSAVKVIYSNTAMYIGAMLYDTHPDSILQEMTERDNFGNTDWFGIVIDAYQDGINGVGFFITPAGIQFDTKYSALDGNNNGTINGGDQNWDAVWSGVTKITEEGWIVEMEIPYSAIRFPKLVDQVWNVNFGRVIRRNREENYWNPVDPELNGFVNQAGQISGISNIESPVRLSATPFVATYLENYHDTQEDPINTLSRSISGGMDVKYGINDAFTLDMTLIPDFGEAQSDNQVLNLSPFEVRFDENRQFFTEGTELFNKGGLFYSRRVGGRPIGYGDAFDQVDEENGEVLLENPGESQLFNATKVSGRTSKGLGLGVFNATAKRTVAKIKNSEGEVREFETSPLTNYNVFVLDQNLKHNSFVTLINTNVTRSGESYDANVTGTQFSLRNKANSYQVSGGGAVSQKYRSTETELGHRWQLNFNKTSGKFQWGTGLYEESDTYDPNDLGFLGSNNEREVWASMRYNVYKPFGNFNSAGGGMFIHYTQLYNPNTFTALGINAWAWAGTKKFFNFGGGTYIRPLESFDYFDTRTDGRYYRSPRFANFWIWASTDYRKRFAFDINLETHLNEEEGRRRYGVTVEPRFRVSDRMLLQWETSVNLSKREVGFVDKDEEEEIIFGRRDRTTVENTFKTRYVFSNKMTLSFRLRHYWSNATYASMHRLGEDGNLYDTGYNSFSDNSFNSFNIDMIYRWRFAPGSDIFIIWKNSISRWTDEIAQLEYDYTRSVRSLTDIPQTNSLSIKIIYFLDYLDFKKKSS
ncbi:MAG: DUF5916 domain-containing protein [Saprospiraceae bacterium]